MPEFFHPESGRRLVKKREATLYGYEEVFVFEDTQHRYFGATVDRERYASVNMEACKRVEREVSALGRALEERGEHPLSGLCRDLVLLVAERRRRFAGHVERAV